MSPQQPQTIPGKKDPAFRNEDPLDRPLIDGDWPTPRASTETQSPDPYSPFLQMK